MTHPPRPIRLVLLLCALAALLLLPATVQARVDVSFQSFNGSMFFGRYPHTFVVFDGRLDDTGQAVHENFGFSALHATPAILHGPVQQTILVEEERYITSTNRHFTVTVSDATYRRMRAEVEAWRNAPPPYYDLDSRNCIHFVGRMAQLAGLRVDYPRKLLRKPRAWLNHVAELNPQIAAQRF